MNDGARARVEVQRMPDVPDGRIMHHVRRAGPADAQHVAGLLGVAFMDDPVTGWLFPDPDDRGRRHPDFFRIFTDRALASGAVYLTADGHAAALWLRIGHGAPPPPIPGEPLAAACGPNLPRMQILDELVEAGHPQHRHDYLSFMGVRPDQQGRGLGAALLRHRIADLDAVGVPAYLEATSPRNRRLYERMGFTALPATMSLPDGPPLFPMWRPAGAGRQQVNPRRTRTPPGTDTPDEVSCCGRGRCGRGRCGRGR
jgi:GNAT superfamily N-acetyltransferase